MHARPSCAVAAVLAAGLSAQAPGVPQEPHETRAHDPFEGMDHDGRIPKARRPADIGHPERWRYFPEGRLKEGSVFDRFLISSFFSPILFREEDIGFGGGVAVTDVDFRNQRRQEFANIVVTASEEGQQQYRINWRRWLHHRELPDGGVIHDERSFWHVNGGYSRTLTRRFFGLGDRTLEADETSYTDEVSGIEIYHQRSIPDPADDLLLRVGVELEHHNLARGRVSTAPSTDDVFPRLFADGDRHDLFWLWGGLWWDTRDSLHNPYCGYEVGVFARVAAQTHGDVGAILGANASWVVPLPPLLHSGGDHDEEHPPTDSFAVGLEIKTADGDLPFYALPSLGGSHALRGFINNRWTGRSSWHAGAEYRFWFVPRGFAITDEIRVERVGAALFYDVGSVGDGLDELLDADVQHSWGAGLRFSLERSALFRVDYGVSEEDRNLSIAYGLAF